MKNYLDITVVIAPGTEGAYAVRVASDKFGQCNSTVKLPFTLRDLSAAVFGAAETARAIGSIAPKEAGPGVAGAADRERRASTRVITTGCAGQVLDVCVQASEANQYRSGQQPREVLP